MGLNFQSSDIQLSSGLLQVESHITTILSETLLDNLLLAGLIIFMCIFELDEDFVIISSFFEIIGWKYLCICTQKIGLNGLSVKTWQPLRNLDHFVDFRLPIYKESSQIIF